MCEGLRVAHFYHAAVDAPGCRRVLSEHFRNLRAANFTGDLFVGLTGSLVNRRDTIAWLRDLAVFEVAAQADEGFEQVTQQALHEFAKNSDGVVYYAHAKGSWNENAHQDSWRYCMETYCTFHWEECVSALTDYDTAGVHFLREGGHPAGRVDYGMYGGNYWWARAGYVAGLPPVSCKVRHEAEQWLGEGRPKAFDFGGGWPDHPCTLSQGRLPVLIYGYHTRIGTGWLLAVDAAIFVLLVALVITVIVIRRGR